MAELAPGKHGLDLIAIVELEPDPAVLDPGDRSVEAMDRVQFERAPVDRRQRRARSKDRAAFGQRKDLANRLAPGTVQPRVPEEEEAARLGPDRRGWNSGRSGLVRRPSARSRFGAAHSCSLPGGRFHRVGTLCGREG
jgi:hypothetical protein